MFRKEMSEKLQKIFGRKVSFDAPSESFEQDVLFVDVQDGNPRVSQDRVSARVVGSIYVFTQQDKLPYGFFNKKIEEALTDSKRDFFFFDVDTNALNSPARLQNISERRAGFVYLYSAPYDVYNGVLTEAEFGG